MTVPLHCRNIRLNEILFAIAKFFPQPNLLMPSSHPSISLTEQLGAFSAKTTLENIPDSVVERATVSLIHNLAVATAGRSREAVAHAMAKRHWSAPQEATLLYDGTRVNVEGAVFANAALMHARSQDDTHAGSTSHPGTPVIAAALAVAEAEGRTGAEFITAVIVGYEILCRTGRDFDHLFSKRGFRAASIVGAFGAAVAVSKLLQLTASETGHALGLAAHFAGGLSQVWEEGSPEFPFQLAFAARNGVLAARAAQAGMTAARETLEGKGGFYRAYADTTEPAFEILDRLGECWQLSDVTVKLYPVCAILQGPVGSMQQLSISNQIAAASVDHIELALSPYEAAYPGIDNAGPFVSSTATKMSAQFSLSACLLERGLTLSDLNRLTDSGIEALASRVRIISDPSIEPRSSRLNVVLNDERKLVSEVNSPVGRPSLQEIYHFAHSLSREIGASSTEIDNLIHEINILKGSPGVGNLIAATNLNRKTHEAN